MGVKKRKPPRKSTLKGYPCFRKTIYTSLKEAEKGATILWGKDPNAKREDLHGYQCPDGCKVNGKKGFHIGHISYFQKHLKTLSKYNIQEIK